MRLYGKRYSKQFIDRTVKKKTENRDAILWDFDWTSNTARVKIQGSNKYVYAHFPQNWRKQPYWAKEGNAVRIRHKQGLRGYVEIVGEGRSIPTPMEGGIFPPAADLPDAILTGLEMSAAIVPTLGVVVTTGTFRINNTVYSHSPDIAGYIVMDDPAPMIMGSNDIMGVGEIAVSFDTAPVVDGEFRYDLVAIGEDNTLDYITGEVSTTPVKPDIPVNHLQVGGYVLVRFGDTEINNSDIGIDWKASTPTYITTELESIVGSGTLSGEIFFQYVASGEAGYPTPEITVRVGVKDQYDLDLTPGAGTYTVSLERTAGTGDVHSDDDGYSNLVSQAFSAYYYDFKYRRDETITEVSPRFKATLDLTTDLSRNTFVMLLDNSGDPIGYE